MSRPDIRAPESRAHAAPPLVEVAGGGWGGGAATGFLLSRLRGAGTLLWVQDRASRRERGRPYLPGLCALLGPEARILHLEVPTARDALWAMEEALGCAALGAVVGEVAGPLDLVATRRLVLRAEAGGGTAWLLGDGAGDEAGPSAARERWHVDPWASGPRAAGSGEASPGSPRWRADLRRARARPPGTWLAWPGPGEILMGPLPPEAPPAAPPVAASPGDRRRAAG